MAFAAALSSLAVMMVHADETQPGWLPVALQLPSDTDVVMDRAIGSSLRMFSFSTERDADALLAEWEEALQQAGYTIDQAQDEVLDQVIEFSGQGILNAKIVIAPISHDGRAIIEFDATLQ